MIYAGTKYLFGRATDFCRIHNIEDNEDSSYRIKIRAVDRFGDTVLTYCTVFELTHKSRRAQVDKAREIITALKNRK